MSRQLPCFKSCPHRVADSVLPAGKSPHRIDAIHGPRRRTLAGVHRGRSPGTKSAAVEPGRSAGSSPPIRLRGRVASHCPPAGGLALPGRRPPPVPPRRSRSHLTLGLDDRLAVGTRLHPRAPGDRMGHSGWQTGSCGGRGLVPAVAAESPPEPDTPPPRSGAGLPSLQHTARCGRGHLGPEAGSAMSRLLDVAPVAELSPLETKRAGLRRSFPLARCSLPSSGLRSRPAPRPGRPGRRSRRPCRARSGRTR
jgi:hypothetical protein